MSKKEQVSYEGNGSRGDQDSSEILSAMQSSRLISRIPAWGPATMKGMCYPYGLPHNRHKLRCTLEQILRCKEYTPAVPSPCQGLGAPTP